MSARKIRIILVTSSLLLQYLSCAIFAHRPEDKLLQSIGRPHAVLANLHKPLELNYGIFRNGRSILRNPNLAWTTNRELTKTTRSLLCLLMGAGDAAHEILLGVTMENVDSAEYAATHPGQTSWMKDHPLSDMDDLLHSILHRSEGDNVGEGGHTGWENAKYWAAGGPKEWNDFGAHENEASTSPHLVIHQALAQIALQRAPRCVAQGVVSPTLVQHSILAGGESRRRRQVRVHPGAWDPFRVIDLCAECLDESTRRELDCLLEWEVRLLLRCEMMWQKQVVTVADLLEGEVSGWYE